MYFLPHGQHDGHTSVYWCECPPALQDAKTSMIPTSTSPAGCMLDLQGVDFWERHLFVGIYPRSSIIGQKNKGKQA